MMKIFWDELPLSVQESIKRRMEQAKSGKTKTYSDGLIS